MGPFTIIGLLLNIRPGAVSQHHAPWPPSDPLYPWLELPLSSFPALLLLWTTCSFSPFFCFSTWALSRRTVGNGGWKRHHDTSSKKMRHRPPFPWTQTMTNNFKTCKNQPSSSTWSCLIQTGSGWYLLFVGTYCWRVSPMCLMENSRHRFATMRLLVRL